MKQKQCFAATLIAVGLLLSMSKLQAQESPPPDSLTRYKWEIGTDLLWLIDKNSLPSNNIFVRRNFTTKNGKQRAWRLRIGGNFKYRDLQEYDTADRFKDTEYRIFLRPGYEWQKAIRKFQVFYGVDLLFDYKRTKQDYFIDSFDGNIDIDGIAIGYTEDLDVGLSPILGVKYFLGERWSISGEANCNIFYRNRKEDFKAYYPPSPGSYTTTIGKFNEKSFNTTINPLYVFNISYHFN